MANLIRSDLFRLFKFISFRCILLYMILGSIIMTMGSGSDGLLVITVAGAIIIGNLIGSDYTHNTVRNKTIAGYSRAEILFSEWITGFTGMIILFALPITSMMISDAFRGTEFFSSTADIISYCGLRLLLVLVLTSFYTAVSAIVSSQTTAMVSSLLSVVIIVVFTVFASIGLYFHGRYVNEEYAQSLAADGLEVVQDTEDTSRYLNPNYVESTEKLSHIILGISPFTYFIAVDIPGYDDLMPVNIAVMSAEFILLTIAGVGVFIVRDVK